jgi:phosphoglycolate phosphatase
MIPLIFDLDGTLVDSAPDIHAAVNQMLAVVGEPPLGADTVRSFIGNGVPMLITRVMHARGHAPDAARHAEWEGLFLRHYEADSATLTTLYPGALAALQALAALGHPLALCTNKPAAPARHILDAFTLGPLFATVIGGDSLPTRKPDPAPLLAATGGGAALFVGDSEVDAETALAARVPFLLFTEGYRKSPIEALPHAARFAHFDDLPALVARLGDKMAQGRTPPVASVT